MAKVNITKLNKIKTLVPITIDVNGENIVVSQYLPLAEKLELIQHIIEQAGNEEEGFYNIIKLHTFYVLEMLKYYTNISFSEKQLEDPAKLYDIICLNHIWDEIKKALPENECTYIWDNLLVLAKEVTNFNHSALGIMRAIKADYNEADFDIANIMNSIKDPEALGLMKEILPLVNS